MRLKGGALCGIHVRRLLVLCAAVAGSGGCAWGQACTLDRATGTTIDTQPFLRNALGSRWNVATDRIAFSQPDAGNVLHVYTMRADRSDRREVAAGKPGQMGAPYWHPSGRYLLFVAQKPEWTGRTVLGIPNYEALPGFGRHDDLWLAAVDRRGMWQLTHDPNTKDEGVLIPVFSADGHKVAWSSRQPGGKYILQVAEFVEAPAPHLTGVRTYQRGGRGVLRAGIVYERQPEPGVYERPGHAQLLA